MRIFKKVWVKAAAFVVFFAFINAVLTFVFMPSGGFTRLMLHELYTEGEELDMIFCGSSLAYPHFNPEIIDRELGSHSFNTGSAAQIYPGNYHVLKEVFAHHSPHKVILTTEWVDFISDQESPKVYSSLTPYIKNPITVLSYFRWSVTGDTLFDRLFLWRGYHVGSFQMAYENVKTKLFDTNYKNFLYESASYDDEQYMGRGYVYRKTTESSPAYNPDMYGPIPHTQWDIADVNPKMIELFEKIVKLCRDNNCELILVNPPRPKIDLLSVSNYFEIDQYIKELADKNGVEYYNFNLAKPELFSIPDEFYYDHSHMNGEGATVFSKSFAKFMKIKEDTEFNRDDYFYTPVEFLKSVDYVTNTWFTSKELDGQIHIEASSLHGTEIEPEYEFILIDEADNVVLRRKYDKSPIMDFTTPPQGVYTLRVNARAVGASEAYTHYYEKKFTW